MKNAGNEGSGGGEEEGEEEECGGQRIGNEKMGLLV